MITINGKKKFDYRNSEVSTLQRDISRLRKLIDSHIKNEPASEDDFPLMVRHMDKLSNGCFVFIDGCVRLAGSIKDAEQEYQKNILGWINTHDFNIISKKYTTYKDKLEAYLIQCRQELVAAKRILKIDADINY